MKGTGAGDHSLPGFCLPTMYKASALQNQGVVSHTCRPNTEEVEAGGAVQGYPWAHTKFKASLDYNRCVLLNE